jgi:hypothetical protein
MKLKVPQASSVDELLDSLEAVLHKPMNVSKLVGMKLQPKQRILLQAAGLDKAFYGGPVSAPTCSWIGFGGAAGGGKSQGAMFIAITAAYSIPGIQIAYFRRTFAELEGADGAIAMSRSMLTGSEAIYNSSKHTWSFPNKSKIHFCHLNESKDIYKYQSSQFGIIIIDEATHMPWNYVEYMTSRLRSSVEWTGLGKAYPFMVLPTNPGNIGMSWYKKLFANNEPYITNTVPSPSNPGVKLTSLFIPSKLSDNRALTERDPDYEAKLDSLNPTLKAMLKDGRWDLAGGLYFSNHFDYDKCVRDIVPESNWKYYGTVDYGFHQRPGVEENRFVYLLCATDTKGMTYVLDEVALSGSDPTQQIIAIRECEEKYNCKPLLRVGCRGMFIKHQLDQPTIGEQYGVNNCNVIRTNVTSVSNAEALIIKYFVEDKIVISPKCIDLIDQLANIPVSQVDPERTDANAPDHAIEALYDFLSIRPTIAEDHTRIIEAKIPTISEILDQRMNQMRLF